MVLNIQSVVPAHFTGSPNCPTVHTTVNTTSLTVSIQKSQLMWLPEWYCVKAVFYNESIASIVGNSTLNGSTSFEVTSLEPDTVYNISVIPCNMAGCNESCGVHSVQTKCEGSGGIGVEGEMAEFARIYIYNLYIHTFHYDLCIYYYAVLLLSTIRIAPDGVCCLLYII